MNKIPWMAAALAGAAAGCGGVYVESPHYEPIAGVYDGYVDERFAHGLIAQDGLTALVLPETGEIYSGQLYSGPEVAYGHLTRYRQVQGSSYSSQAVAAEHGSFDAPYFDGEVLDGTFEGPQSLRYAELFFDGATTYAGFLPQGVFENTDFITGFNTRIVIDHSGRIEGDDSEDCFYSGRISDASGINVRSLRLTVDCPAFEWTGDGVASIYRAGGSETLLLAASDGERAYAAELLRE